MVMNLNSAWNKNSFREIKKTLERYIAILAIIALGVGFFAGLKVTTRAMVQTLDNYVNEYQMYDFRLISSLGLTDDDVRHFDNLDNMTAEGLLSIDFIANAPLKNEIVLKAYSITENINKLKITSGRMATKDNECIVDDKHFTEKDIGSKIIVANSNKEETKDNFRYKEYTIVGLANSVNYISHDRGTTKIGNGSIEAFVYIPKGGFSIDYYTEVVIKLADNEKAYSEEYDNLISSYENSLKYKLEARANLRYESILDEAYKKLSEAQEEFDKANEEFMQEKTNAMKDLEDAWEQLKKAKNDIRENEKELLDGEKELEKAEKQYYKSLEDYEDSLLEYESHKKSTFETIKAQQMEIDYNRKLTIEAIEEIENLEVIDRYNDLTNTILELTYALDQFDNPASEEYIIIYTQLEQAKAARDEIEASGVIENHKFLKNTLLELDAAQKELDKARAEADIRFKETEAELSLAKSQLDSAKEQIENNKQEIKKGWTALEEGKYEYEKGLKEYEDGKKEAEDRFADAEEELKKAKKEIEDAKEEIANIPSPTVYVMNRSYNIGYTSFENDSSIVDGIAKILPLFFFLVAALVCTTTMNRMVDEQRLQIGTLKALGYSNGAITAKYILYSGSASILGCIIGFILGTRYFPMAIWTAYGMLYDFAPIEYVFDVKLAVISLIASLACSVGVTYISCKNELLQMPATLLRPKAPESGKRILLERIPVIWSKVSFLHKVSIRNIFRYKKRLLMTVLGIIGCTSLILAALGIRDSITNIAHDQFDTIMTYDYIISFSESQSFKERQNFIDRHGDLLGECVFTTSETVEVLCGDKIKSATVVATDDPKITSLVGLYYNGEKVSYPTQGKAVINDKLAVLGGLKAGDTLTIKVSDTELIEVEVEGVFENYVGNYLFMTGETYEDLFKSEPNYNSAYATTNYNELYSVSATLSESDGVVSVSVLNDLRTMVDNMMNSLDYIIWLVIACAGALAFVVMYNLNNINITERAREIATIKVLGFYAKETYSYIFRENIILTVLGTFFGLGLGKLLHKFIMAQLVIDFVTFKVQISYHSYIISVIVTIVLTLFVNLLLKRKIDNINMAESLKSIE